MLFRSETPYTLPTHIQSQGHTDSVCPLLKRHPTHCIHAFSLKGVREVKPQCRSEIIETVGLSYLGCLRPFSSVHAVHWSGSRDVCGRPVTLAVELHNRLVYIVVIARFEVL